jgi:hypothetical protein
LRRALAIGERGTQRLHIAQLGGQSRADDVVCSIREVCVGSTQQ